MLRANVIDLFCQPCQVDSLLMHAKLNEFKALFGTFQKMIQEIDLQALNWPILGAICIGAMHSMKPSNEQDKYSEPISLKITSNN